MGASCSCLDSVQLSARKDSDQPLEASFEGQLPEHRGKPNLQQTPAGNDETYPGLDRLTKKMRSLERGMPGSNSSPNILADTPNSDEAHGKEAAAQALAAKEAQMQRCQSWSQAPAIISRLTSWKEAGQDYSAMQVALQNFPTNDSEYTGRASSVPSQSVALQQQDRELSSAPELFTDAAMRNALRKIAAMQAKPQARSRASSAHTSAFVSSRVSSEEDAAAAAPSRDGSPGGVLDAVQRNIAQGKPSYSGDLSGLPPGSRVASSDAGSRPCSRPASTDAYYRATPAHTYNHSHDILSGHCRRQGSSEAQHSRPASVDGLARAQAHSSRGASGDHGQGSRASSAQLAPPQRSSSESTAALSATSRASDELRPVRGSHLSEEHHWQEPGSNALGDVPELAPSDRLTNRSAGPFGAGMARQWGPAASGMRRVPENKAAEAFEVLMSKAQGSQPGSINSEDAAAVQAYMRDNMANRRTSTDSGRSADSRVSSVGKLDGSAVVHASDAHAALRRAMSLVKQQERAERPMDERSAEEGRARGQWHAMPREKKGSLKLPTELKSELLGHLQGDRDAREATQRGEPHWPEKPSQEKQQPMKKGHANGYSARTSDAAVQAFVRGAFGPPSGRASADAQSG